MASIKTNINFVNHLLNTKGISERQRFIILSLFNSEMLNYEQELINQFLNSGKDGLTLDGVLDPVKNKNIIYHLPKRTTHLLKLFTANDILKYTTHSWDRNSDGLEVIDRNEFLNQLEKEFKKEKFKDLRSLGLESLYWTIYNYLFRNYSEGNIYQNSNGWGKAYDYRLPEGFKFGWGCSDFIEYYRQGKNNYMDYQVPKKFRPVKYTSDYINRCYNEEKKQKDESKLDKRLLEGDNLDPNSFNKLENRKKKLPSYPEPILDDIEEVYSIDELAFSFFEDFVFIFKKQIEFRGNDFYNFLRKEFNKQDRMDNTVSIEGVKGLNIYTDTVRIKTALSKISENLKRREKGKNIQITGSVSNDNTHVIIDINDVESFSRAHIESTPKLNLKEKVGDIWKIRDDLASLCDFSIISIFKDKDGKEKTYEIAYLDQSKGKIAGNEPQYSLSELKSKPIGFTYRLKFYL